MEYYITSPNAHNLSYLVSPFSPPSTMSLKISLHNSKLLKLLIFFLTLSSSLTETTSDALRSGHGIYIDSKIPYLLGALVLPPLFASTWIVWSHQRRKLERHRMSLFDRNGGNILKEKLSKREGSAHLKIYTAQEMENATNNYSERGEFYRGTFENNREAAVMKIPSLVPESKIEQFIDEVIRRSLRGGNVIRISGFCLETSFPLLVYEHHVDGNRALSGFMRGGAGVLPRAKAVLLQLLRWRRAPENGGDSVSGAVDDEESGGAVEERPTSRELEDELK
ncbi:wall-associated receptor kinase-like 22 [Salvia miltiorrhiza]|uniref:wall-associated receptor kinase-like 22 n=1 Tax=Salvia miltiorrhiza TaxID=226208 RepID=UPI0025AD2289|nr:wall-associated receptor kinase-like 22 [Salvia miltiorrhiza]